MARVVFAVFAFFLFLIPSVGAEASPFRVNSGAGEPLSNASGTGYYNRVMTEMFKRLGMKHDFVSLPSERSLVFANNGTDDANIARIRGMEKKWPNLIRVPEPVITWEFTAYSHTVDVPVTGWDSFKPYNVGMVRGWQIYENNLKGVASLTRVTTSEQLFALLDAGRIDVAVHEKIQATYFVRNNLRKPKALSPPVKVTDLYLYVNKKHAGLVPKMTETLKAMRADGSIDQLYADVLAGR